MATDMLAILEEAEAADIALECFDVLELLPLALAEDGSGTCEIFISNALGVD